MRAVDEAAIDLSVVRGRGRRAKAARRPAKALRAGPAAEVVHLSQKMEGAVTTSTKETAVADAPASEAPAAVDNDAPMASPLQAALPAIRVDYADTPPPGTIILVEPEPGDPFDDAEVTAPRRAYPEAPPPVRGADVLPPRNRRPLQADQEATPPRARRLEGAAPADRAEVFDRTAARANEQPASGPRPAFGQPLFHEDWGSPATHSPTWKPGAPPREAKRSLTNWWIVGVVSLLGAGAFVLWLHTWA
jgi:hypothetical protein